MAAISGGTALGSQDRLLLPVLVYLPLTLFMAVLFYAQHMPFCQSSRSLWLDKLCIHQTDTSMKAAQVMALPVFVSRTDQMLVLWDDTYFERLWCNLELATFAKHGHLNKITVLPLWLAPWLLSSIACNLFTVILLVPLLEGGMSDSVNSFIAAHVRNFAHNAVHVAADSPLLDCLSVTLSDATVYVLAYLPTWIPSLISFQRKISYHRRMLEQMATFDFCDAKCTEPADRNLVEQQVEELFKYDIDYSGTCTKDDPMFQASCEDAGVLFSDPDVMSTFHKSSLQDEDPLSRFNAYVQGPLKEAVLQSIGHELHMPWHLCIAALLPLLLYSLVDNLGCVSEECDAAAMRYGFSSVMAFKITGCLGWMCQLLLIYPISYPILLQVMGWVMSATQGWCQLLLLALCCPLVHMYCFLSSGVFWALIDAVVNRFSLRSLLTFTAAVVFFTLQACFLFGFYPERAIAKMQTRLLRQPDGTYKPLAR